MRGSFPAKSAVPCAELPLLMKDVICGLRFHRSLILGMCQEFQRNSCQLAISFIVCGLSIWTMICLSGQVTKIIQNVCRIGVGYEKVSQEKTDRLLWERIWMIGVISKMLFLLEMEFIVARNVARGFIPGKYSEAMVSLQGGDCHLTRRRGTRLRQKRTVSAKYEPEKKNSNHESHK